jgi:hypothetical protein
MFLRGRLDDPNQIELAQQISSCAHGASAWLPTALHVDTAPEATGPCGSRRLAKRYGMDSQTRSQSCWEKRDAWRESVSEAVTLARGGSIFGQSNLDRIREERVTPLVQGPHEVRSGVDCSTFALAPFSSVGIERKVPHVVVAGLFPMID